MTFDELQVFMCIFVRYIEGRYAKYIATVLNLYYSVVEGVRASP